MSFPDSKQMTEYKKYLEEAAKRDHRKIGKDQELWVFSELSPGSPFLLPMGMRIYNTLLAYIKVSFLAKTPAIPADRYQAEYHKRGFSEGE
jgi:threonyl-tRNA synthetase